MKKLIVLSMAVLGLAACDRSKPELEKTLVQVQQISSEKDSLLKDVMATSQFMAELNTELAKVKSRNAGKPVKGGSGEMENNMTPAEQRAAVVRKVQELTTRINEAESRLNASRKRVQDLAGNNTALTKQLAAYDSTIASFKSIIDTQKAELASLTEQVNALTGENNTLKADKAMLATERDQLNKDKAALILERNTAYYVIGSKQDLLKRRIIQEMGGALGIGKTEVAARDLDPNLFTLIDKSQVNEIKFPKEDKAYKILTRQNTEALETTPGKGGKLKGGLKISNPDKFWGTSKYLILVEQ